MGKIAAAAPKKNISKTPSARKRAAPPFADKIPLIRSLVLDSVKPGTIKKIYLFGSYAYGKPTKKSDIDLCVIIKDDLDYMKIQKKIALALYDNSNTPVDTLLYKENEFNNFSNFDGIENVIFTEGKVIYEQNVC
jgi:predicted nucleotidyltransferase